MTEQTISLNSGWNLFSRLRQDSDTFKKLLFLALPIAAQNLVQTLLNMVDTLMIGQLGETAIAAVALSNQVFFLLMLLLFGISSGTSVFTAQFWGKKDLLGIHRSLGMALLLGLFAASLYTAAALIFPAEILRLFSKDEAVIQAGVSYLKIASISYIFTAGTIIFQGVLRSIGVVRLPLILSVSALSLNAFFNYALIFGKFGMPEMGITGAALATTGARILEMTALIFMIYKTKSPVAASIKEMLNQNRKFTRQFFHKVNPVILNEFGWSMGMTMFTLVYARMGTEILAAYNIMETFSRLAFIFFVGTANAAAIVLGNMIGEGRKEEAKRVAKTVLLSVPILSAAIGVLIFFLAPLIPSLFNVSDYVSTLVVQLLRILTIVLFIKASNMHIIIAVLRSGGDTHFCAKLELLPLWLISIPLVAIAGLVFHLHPALVYLFCLSEEIVKYITGLWRVHSEKWVHDLT